MGTIRFEGELNPGLPRCFVNRKRVDRITIEGPVNELKAAVAHVAERGFPIVFAGESPKGAAYFIVVGELDVLDDR
jgi:hypothetical protein